jgi:GNAT superfamily N-acetyltransferase
VVDIRPVRPSEHERLGALTRAAYATLFDDLDADGYGAELEDVAGRADHALVLVAVDGGDGLVGGVTYVGGPGTPMSEFTDAEAAGIRMLAVDPARHGGGVGRRLVEACIARARADDRRRVILHTLPVMEAARHLYEDLGFARDESLDVPVESVGVLLAYRLEL